MITIGIVLAFQLNSWWETRKEKQKANQMMSRLEDELTRNLTIAERQIREMSDESITYDSVLTLIYGVHGPIDQERLAHAMRALPTGRGFLGRWATLESIVRSNEIDLIEDDSLINDLEEFYYQRDFVRLVEEDLSQEIEQEIRDSPFASFVIGNRDTTLFSSRHKELLAARPVRGNVLWVGKPEHLEFQRIERILLLRKSYWRATLGFRQNQKENLEYLVSELNQKLAD